MPSSSLQWSARIDRQSQARLKAALEQFPAEAQDAVVRRAFKDFARVVIAKAKGTTESSTIRRALTSKVKRYRGVAWLGIGHRTGRLKENANELIGRSKRAAYDAAGGGWRSHFYELGWHSWSPSFAKPPKGAGKGWKRRRRHRGRGVFNRGEYDLSRAFTSSQGMLGAFLVDSINAAAARRSR